MKLNEYLEMKSNGNEFITDFYVDTSVRKGHVIVDNFGYRFSSAAHAKGWIRYSCNKKNRGCRARIFVVGDSIIRRVENHCPNAHKENTY